jgi:hypothetical protein
MRSFRAIAVLAALAANIGTRADEQPAPPPQQPPPPSQWQTTPPPQAPDAPPPAPEATPAPPPQQDQPQAQAAPAPSGQWVYTQQYGWIWMPYGANYTSIPYGYDYPVTYAFQIGIGWSWIAAPWVYGWGPWPYFGVAGAFAYPWYGWGYWRYPAAYYPYRAIPPYRPGYRPVAPAGVPYHAGGYAPGYVPGAAPHVGAAPRGYTPSHAHR